MQDYNTLTALLEKIKYKDWIFVLNERADCWTIQITFEAVSVTSGKRELQFCRKWFISKHMTDNEVIRTVHLAVEVAERHEMSEHFTFNGKLISNPHVKVQNIPTTLIEDLDMRPGQRQELNFDECNV